MISFWKGGKDGTGIVGVIEEPIVSSDVIQDPCALIIDLEMTRVVDGDLIKVQTQC
jgi:glyceraldehyde 3-phosphate dehydrogenase